KGLAEAEAMAAKTRSWADYNEAALTDRVLSILPELAAAVSAPLAQTDKIVMMGGGNGDGSGASRITADVTHVVVELPEVLEDAFSEGLGFDGSSVRGFQEIAESDMVLLPDATTALIDPFHEHRTLSVICDVIDPITRERYSRDPRYIAHKAQRYLVETGIADTAYFGPEAEFFIFDHVAFSQEAHKAFYEVDSEQAYWNMGEGFGGSREGKPNLGY